MRYVNALRRRRARAERGSVLLEMAMITPMLLFISLAVLDIGLGWRTSLTVSNSVRAGARVATNLGKATSADESALKAVGAALGDIPVAEIDVVVIFKASSSTTTVPPQCLTAASRTAGGNYSYNCNTYTGDEVRKIAGGLTGAPSFGNCTSRHKYWCPTNRLVAQSVSVGPDHVGVFVRINHKTVTKALGATITVDETAVMVIEPGAGAS